MFLRSWKSVDEKALLLRFIFTKCNVSFPVKFVEFWESIEKSFIFIASSEMHERSFLEIKVQIP